VGLNQATEYKVDAVGRHARFMDALFNRRGECCRRLYNRVREENKARQGKQVRQDKSSPTRQNIDHLNKVLRCHGVRGILETNMICYSTPTGKGLADPAHVDGRERGKEIFRFLLGEIRPRVLIVHGIGAYEGLASVLGLGRPLCSAPQQDGDVVRTAVETQNFSGTVFPIQSLAPPAWYRWRGWARQYLDRLAEEVAMAL
jgi:hypothetical protein